jgi:hypothetical protein
MPENEAAPADAGQPPPPADGQAPVPDQAPEPGIEGPVQQEPPALPDAGELQDKVPTNVMDKQVPGVKQGGLPQIGQEAGPSDVEGKAEVNDLPPVQKFARAFQPEGKPLFAILLQDVGAAGMTRAELAKLPFPVSVVIDPLSPDASQAMADWRAAGQEVVMLGNGLPVGATAGDVETTFAALGKVLPEAVAVLDPDLGGFQDNRPLATLVLPVIGGQGWGLITWDRGLNAADQIAQRENVPAAVIFRKLDGEGESKEVMRRYLDRAAFKAAQEGAVVVIGDTRPETVATILEWAVEGRSGTVSLAPITAVMSR